MTHIEAIYRRRVFEPLGPVDLREDQRVHLRVEAPEQRAVEAWLHDVQTLQAKIVARGGGPLPDCSREMAADRLR